MTITQIDGFDLYAATTGTGVNNVPLNSVWTLAGGLAMIAGRFGGQAVSLTSSSATIKRAVLTPVSSVSLGVACLFGVLPGSDVGLMQFLDTGGVVLDTVALTSTGAIALYRSTITGLNLLGTSAGGVITAGAYQYIEVELTISDTVGVFNVYVNGVAIISLSTQDTKPGTNTTIASVLIGNISSSPIAAALDDYYLTDTAARLGEQRVETLRANGNTAQDDWAKLSGASAFAMTGETLIDGDTSYIFDSTVGHKTTVDLSNLGSTPASITAVQVSFSARKDDATSRQVRDYNVSGAVTSNGATQAMSSTYAKFNDIFPVDPNTSAAWTASAVNALQVGVEVIT